MAALRLSTGSRMSAWPGWAWAAKVDGSICMSPRGVAAGLPPEAATLAAAGSSDDSCWAIVRRAGAHEAVTPVRATASAIHSSTLLLVPPLGADAIAVRRWAAKLAPAGAAGAAGGGGAKRWQIS